MYVRKKDFGMKHKNILTGAALSLYAVSALFGEEQAMTEKLRKGNLKVFFRLFMQKVQVLQLNPDRLLQTAALR